MRNVKFKLLLVLLLLLESAHCARSQSFSWRETTLADYSGIYLNAGVYYDNWEGWTMTTVGDETYWVSPRFDLSQAKRPVLELGDGMSHIIDDRWESWYGPCYNIDVSTDGTTWKTLDKAKRSVMNVPLTAHYIRLNKNENLAFLRISEDISLKGYKVNTFSAQAEGCYEENGEYICVAQAVFPPMPEDWEGTEEDWKNDQEEFTWKFKFDLRLTNDSLANFENGYFYIDKQFSEYDSGPYGTETEIQCYAKVNGEYLLLCRKDIYWDTAICTPIPKNTEELRLILDVERWWWEWDGFSNDWKNNPKFPFKVSAIEHYIWPISTDLRLSANRVAWYDVDGDGTMEWHGGNILYQFTADYGAALELGKHYGDWVNLNNDEHIDTYDHSRGSLWLGDERYTNEEEEAYAPGFQVSPIDYDNDGRPDLLRRGDNVKNTRLLDYQGRWQPAMCRIVTPAEYEGQRIIAEPESDGRFSTSIPGMGEMISWAVECKPNPALYYTSYITTDLNGDGLADFVDYTNGDNYLGTPEGMLIKMPMAGQAYFRDFNGDNLADYVTNDLKEKKVTLHTLQKDGSWTTQDLLKGIVARGDLWCYDFDKDGDTDILIPVDKSVRVAIDYPPYTHDNNYAFLVMMENQGNGRFKRHENALANHYFKACVDIDGDGLYEAIAVDKGQDPFNTVAFKIDGLKVNTTPTVLLEGLGGDDMLVADIDNSGITRVFTDGYGSTTKPLSTKRNARPEAPGTPRCAYDAAKGTLQVTWDPATDKEAATSDLTYELRIGSAPGKGDYLFAHSLPDGRRRILAEGNNSYYCSRTLNVSAWPAGTYYIDVQAIDPNYSGSAFSATTTFRKDVPGAGFILSHRDNFAVLDTCLVTLKRPCEEGVDYQWELGDARILSKDANNAEFKICFDRPGEKTIALQAITADGKLAFGETQILSVQNASPVTSDTIPRIQFSFDLDEDGKMEAIIPTRIDYQTNVPKVYEGNDNGYYQPVKAIYNTNFNLVDKDKLWLIDRNRDGMVDIFSAYSHLSQTHLNEGNKMLNMGEGIAITGLPKDFHFWADMDNDGDLDVIAEEEEEGEEGVIDKIYLYINNGDYQDFSNKSLITIPDEILHLTRLRPIDFDGDGLIDICDMGGSNSWDASWGTRILLRNNGDYTFTKIVLDKDERGPSSITDLDGDNMPEFIYYNKEKAAYEIFWSDNTTTEVPTDDDRIIGTHDFDNNGTPDLVLGDHYIFFNTQKEGTLAKGDLNYKEYRGHLTSIFRRTDDKLFYGSYDLSRIPNERSAAPTHLRAVQGSKAVVIEWNDAADKETPARQMRYNISIKRKGVTGEGAYLLSPLNSTKNGVHVSPQARLLCANRITLPIASIPAGAYEVQVQAVDLQYLASDFSEVYDLVVTESSTIDMPTATMVETETTIRVATNEKPTIDFGPDATARLTADGTYSVSWSAPGMKQIAIDGTPLSNGCIYVHPKPEGDIQLPAHTLCNATLTLSTRNANQGSRWEVAFEDEDFVPVEDAANAWLEVFNDTTVLAGFTGEGNFRLRHVVTAPYGTAAYTAATQVTTENATPAIGMVHADGESGKFRIVRDMTAATPAEAVGINVYKETTQGNTYTLIGRMAIDEATFTDPASTPNVKTERYRLSYALSYGESAPGKAHQPPHVMLTQGAGQGINVIWTPYEGAAIESYRILCGTTPDDLALTATVSGSHISYTDVVTEPAAVRYYAVEAVMAQSATTAYLLQRRNGGSTTVRSNTVSTSSAGFMVPAEELVILSKDARTTISDTDPSPIELQAFIYPTKATVKQIRWTITTGGDYAEIDASGRVWANGLGNGTVVVRACTMDGSDVTGEITLQIDGMVTGTESLGDGGGFKLSVAVENERLKVQGLPADGNATTLSLYAADGKPASSLTTRAASCEISCQGLPDGVYVIVATHDGITKSARFVK